jgi:hypothetical protein
MARGVGSALALRIRIGDEPAMTDRRVRAFLLLLLVGWAIVLTVASLSSISRSKLRLRSSNPSSLTQRSMRHNHRLAHCAAFGLLSFLLGLLSRRTPGRIASLLAVIALGTAIEFAQHWIYSIPTEVGDIRDDSYGALLGMLTATLLVKLIQRQNLRATRWIVPI